jgi:uncharacterized membrane-anchored protein
MTRSQRTISLAIGLLLGVAADLVMKSQVGKHGIIVDGLVVLGVGGGVVFTLERYFEGRAARRRSG